MYDIVPLDGDASDRTYYRLKRGKHSLIVMDSSRSKKAMKDFLAVGEYLSRCKLSVPQIYHTDTQQGYMILEDLGMNTLSESFTKDPTGIKQIYTSVVELLIFLHSLTHPPLPAFDKQFFLNELSDFLSWYILYADITVGQKEQDTFLSCWNTPLEYLSKHDNATFFVHKDLHCGNLFWLPKREGVRNIGIIDFQNAKKGSASYDITSLLYDCRMTIDENVRKELLNMYITKLGLDPQTFTNICAVYIAQRNIKILGNFAKIHMKKKNDFYLAFLPSVWTYIQHSFNNPLLADVKDWFERMGIQKTKGHQV